MGEMNGLNVVVSRLRHLDGCLWIKGRRIHAETILIEPLALVEVEVAVKIPWRLRPVKSCYNQKREAPGISRLELRNHSKEGVIHLRMEMSEWQIILEQFIDMGAIVKEEVVNIDSE
jgi:hypothetical protein